MAKVFGPGFSFRARGSIGNVQYRKTRRSGVVCLYKNKPGTVSASQAVVRACMSALTAACHLLFEAQLIAWRTAAAVFDFRWGSFAYFTYVNMPRARAGDPLLSWPANIPVSAWELDLAGSLMPASGYPAGVCGLWDLVNVPDLEFSPGVSVLLDTFFEVDGVGDVTPIIS